MQLLTLIPALAAIIYAVVVKIRQRNKLDFMLITLGGSIALFNEFFMYGFFTGQDTAIWLRCVQQVISCMIVPIAYMYFASQIGFKWLNGYTVAQWLLLLLLLTPTAFFTLDGVIPEIAYTTIEPMTLHYYSKGKEVFYTHPADIVILLQAMVTLYRMFVMALTLRRYHLAVSPRMRYFLIWWAMAIAFIIFCALFSTEELSQPAMLWTYYISYSILIIAIFILLALNFDLRPIMLAIDHEDEEEISEAAAETNEPVVSAPATGITVEDNAEPAAPAPAQTDSSAKAAEPVVVENIATFVLQGRVMAEQLRTMLNNGCYRNPDLCLDDIIAQLGTNRTYFSRMMKAEFGCTFTELLTNHRMQYAEHLLLSTDMNITEIAQKSGFADNGNFTRRFRQTHGIPPSQFREK